MDEPTSGDMAPVSEPAHVDESVERQLPGEPASAALAAHEKIAKATGIYTAWRNENLGGLPSSVFAQIETASPALIAAIVAVL